MKDDSKLVTVEYVIPADIQDEIAKKISDAVVNGYYGGLAEKIRDIVIENLEDDDFINNVAKEVLDKVRMSKKEFVDNISKQIKKALLETTSIIANETLKKVQEKVQSYGFIKIGERY